MRHQVPADTGLEIVVPESTDPEAMTEPASITGGRRQTRLAWTIAAIAVIGLLVASGVAWHLHEELSSARHHNAIESPTTAARVPPADVNNPSEFVAQPTTLQGLGLVAIASDGHLRVVDGQHKVVRDTHQHVDVARPQWSPSGRWLSYALDNTEVWVTTAGETQAHQVGTVVSSQPDAVAWSPADDTLAMVTAAGVALVSPDRPGSRPLAHTDGAWSLSWSPDGRSLAVLSTQARGLRLVALSPAGGDERQLAETPAPNQTLTLAGWWPDGRGVLVWRSQDDTRGTDGMDLVSISLSGKEVRLTTMLPYHAWISWSPDRRHLVVVEGKGPEASTGKHLAVCDVVAGTCHSIAGAPGTVSLDPAWSPDGSQIAYVQAFADPGPGYGTWMNTRWLWTMRPDGSGAMGLGAVQGAESPRWLADSKRVLVVGRENRLYLVGRAFTAPVAERLYQSEFPPGYSHGFVDWSDSLAWHPG